jgi:hypothetical protein
MAAPGPACGKGPASERKDDSCKEEEWAAAKSPEFGVSNFVAVYREMSLGYYSDDGEKDPCEAQCSQPLENQWHPFGGWFAGM